MTLSQYLGVLSFLQINIWSQNINIMLSPPSLGKEKQDVLIGQIQIVPLS
jgi:hypothetical protein